jgi:hypothetical protein
VFKQSKNEMTKVMNKKAVSLAVVVILAFSMVLSVGASYANPGYTQGAYFYYVDSDDDTLKVSPHGNTLVVGYDVTATGIDLYLTGDTISTPIGDVTTYIDFLALASNPTQDLLGNTLDPITGDSTASIPGIAIPSITSIVFHAYGQPAGHLTTVYLILY